MKTTGDSNPTRTSSADEFTLRAARALLRQDEGDLQALPPRLQRALLEQQRQRNAESHARTVQAHANAAQADGPEGVLEQAGHGLKATGGAVNGLYRRACALDKVDEAQTTERDLHQQQIDRFERRLSTCDPNRYSRYQTQQAQAERDIAADANPDSWRRREIDREEAARSQALLAGDERAWANGLDPTKHARHEARQRQDMDSIQESSAPGAVDHASVRLETQARERAQLARDPQAWKASLPADRRRALEARHLHDDTSIMASGLEAVRHSDGVKDVVTLGAHSASKREGASGAVAELLTLGSWSLTQQGAQDLGRGSAYRDHAAQMRASGAAVDGGRFDVEADRLQRSGGAQVGLGALNMLMMKGTAGRAAASLPERAGTAAEGDLVLRGEVALEQQAALPRPSTTGPWQYRLNRGVPEQVRLAPSNDGLPAWTETLRNGRIMGERRYVDRRGRPWVEYREGDAQWSVRGGSTHALQQEARARGTTLVGMEGPGGREFTVQVHGAPSEQELVTLIRYLEKAPPAARLHARDIYLSQDLGHAVRPDGRVGPVVGLGGDGAVTLDRHFLRDGPSTLYHEVGHNVDRAAPGGHSTRGAWGKGRSVTEYGASNAAEDFAEVHADVLSRWHVLTRQGKLGWALEPCADKKAEILRLYGVEAQRFTESDSLLMLLAAGAAVVCEAERPTR